MEALFNKSYAFARQNSGLLALYIVLLGGGVWHALDLLQQVMLLLASPIIIGLSLFVTSAYMRQLARPRQTRLFLLWAASVVLLGFAVEWLGASTGKVFGVYAYSDALQPVLLGVPVAIGFAWLGTLLGAAALTERLFATGWTRTPLRQACVTAAFMVLFDFFIEPAAMKLDYWQWQGGVVPVQNYLAWYLFGWIFSLAGYHSGALGNTAPRLAVHAYWGQIAYFVIVTLAKV